MSEDSRDAAARTPSFEDVPLTRSEYITAMVHFYRGEMSRANTWRNRLDATTNWAVVTVAAMLTFTFSDPVHPHVTLLLTNLLICVFLGFEARRFRYFDVWRSRIRMLEENFFIPIILRNLVSPRDHWRDWVSQDLDHPTFKISLRQAVATRLRHNYLPIFAVILVAWMAKLNLHPKGAANFGEVLSRMEAGPVPGVVIGTLTLVFYLVLLWIAFGPRGKRTTSDEVSGVEAEIDHWKT